MTQEATAYKAPQDSAVTAIVPILVVSDVSASMGSGPGTISPIDVVNTGIESLINTLKVHPEAADCALVGIAKFSTAAEMVMPFTHIGAAAIPPRMQTEGSTEFGNAFSLARRELEAMVTFQKASGATVYRPTVYMITDGEPTDNGRWEAELDALGTSSYAPNICVFGVAGASEGTLRKIARRDRGHVWLADQGTDPASAFAALFPALVRSVMMSASAAAATPGEHAAVPAPIPVAIPGMTTLDPM
ncbi:VWA domain-containing protein [Pseudarthrobacter sp. fls2-241-R2A-168]|uniref:vWA domain-containing protein n=1 Tax=Pseudarthrobacter sp. fls2-241-R2A-168 TaxID=3040304 RepID=UPI0025555C93|nr:VWA domain-containing protein [Pseudarthrobacter sp. fls2-241-R2A-168]